MTVSLAMLLQSQPDPGLDAAGLVRQLLADWPDLDPALLRVSELAPDQVGREEDELPLSIDYDTTLIALMPIPFPIGDDIAEIVAHSRLWPNAQPAPVDYAAHTIVTVMSFAADGSEPDAIGQAVLLSKVLASAIALSSQTEAVYFGSANHVVLPALFRELARDMLPEPLSIAWVATNVGQRPDGVMTGHTRGMQMLGLMDIEIPESNDSAETVFKRLQGISDYLIQNGPVIADGDTLGDSAKEKIQVVYAASALDDGRQVMQLRTSAQQAETAKPWWKKLLN